jgi:hypothetical protein
MVLKDKSKYTGQSIFWGTEEITHLLWNRMVLFYVHKTCQHNHSEPNKSSS